MGNGIDSIVEALESIQMQNLVYPWKRYWYPPGEDINLGDDGFLLDPTSEHAKYFPGKAFSFESIAQTPCLVLLGEPGSGKTNAIKMEFEQVGRELSSTVNLVLKFDLGYFASEDSLVRTVFENDQIKNWLAGQHTLHLFLDSLDEGLLRIDTISRVLRTGLESLPTESLQRLRLRIASRQWDWPESLETDLKMLWPDKVGVFKLAPLMRSDIHTAAELNHVDPSQFIEAIRQSTASAFAIKPVTLEFLIKKFKKDGTLPASLAELYFEGCRSLCVEPNPERNTPKLTGKLSIGQRFQIAARIAAVTQFSNRSAICKSISGVLPEDVHLDALMGGSEGEGASFVSVDLEAVREVLSGTSLFQPRGLNRQGWSHQSYPEYLAAYFLKSHGLPLEQLKQYIADDSGKVYPQLRETASWLATISGPVFDLLAESDPEVLLSANLIDQHRLKLATRILEAFDSGALFESALNASFKYERLKCPGLAAVLEPYLSIQPYLNKKGSHKLETRIAAVSMVRDCKVSDLQKNVAAIALNANQDQRIRSHAAATVVSIGDHNTKASLRQLALGMAGKDDFDDLKGYGLTASWPEHISAKELFAAIVEPAKLKHFGSYRRFLDSEFLKWLEPEHMDIAVTWARKHPKDDDHWNPLPNLALSILKMSVDHIDQQVVLDVFVSALFERNQLFANSSEITKRLAASGEDVRRRVAQAMFPLAANVKNGSFALIDVCGIQGHDVIWLLSELAVASNQDVRRLIIETVIYILNILRTPPDASTLEAVWAAGAKIVDFWNELRSIVGPITLDFSHSENLRGEFLKKLKYKTTAKVEEPIVSMSDRLAEGYSRHGEDFFQIYMHLRPHQDFSIAEPIPGWLQFADIDKERILEAARNYLNTLPPCLPGEWWKERERTLGQVASYQALHLLALVSPESLDNLLPSDWAGWSTLIVAYCITSDVEGSRNLLITKAHQRAKDVFFNTISELIDCESTRPGGVSVLSRLGNFWNDELATLLHSKLATSGLPPSAFGDIITKLLNQHDPLARELARSLGTRTNPPKSDAEQRAAYATLALVRNDAKEWKGVWKEIQKNEGGCIYVLHFLSSGHDAYSFPSQLDAEDLSDLCIWLAKRGLEMRPDGDGKVSPQQTLADWWNTLVNELVQKGTAESCRALERLIDELPQYREGLRSSLKATEERRRRSGWTPMLPEDVIRTANCMATKLVLSLHGIRTRGEWQNDVSFELQNNRIRNKSLDYGYFWALQLLTPWCRRAKIEWFKKEYEKIIQETGIKPSLIAHSFGTYIVANAIRKYPEIRFERIIFCGSIVRRDFDWAAVVKIGQVEAVLNQCGGEDFWVKVADWFVGGAGRSGVEGFSTNCSQVIQQIRTAFSHSNYFYRLNYVENWIPFLHGAAPSTPIVK